MCKGDYEDESEDIVLSMCMGDYEGESEDIVLSICMGALVVGGDDQASLLIGDTPSASMLYWTASSSLYRHFPRAPFEK